jgi:hypothetical protein
MREILGLASHRRARGQRHEIVGPLRTDRGDVASQHRVHVVSIERLDGTEIVVERHRASTRSKTICVSAVLKASVCLSGDTSSCRLFEACVFDRDGLRTQVPASGCSWHLSRSPSGPRRRAGEAGG